MVGELRWPKLVLLVLTVTLRRSQWPRESLQMAKDKSIGVHLMQTCGSNLNNINTDEHIYINNLKCELNVFFLL